MSQYAKYPSSGSSIPIPVPIADGGTGATTAAGALTNLGAANNHLSNLVSPTAVNQALLLLVGSAAVPSLSFQGDTGTGLYDAAAGSLGFAGSGVSLATLANDGLGNGILTLPATNSGMLIGASLTDVAVSALGQGGLTIGVTPSGTAQGPQILINSFTNSSVPALYLANANGTPSVPTNSLAGDQLGALSMYGFDSANYAPGSEILTQVNSDWTTSSHSSNLILTSQGSGGSATLSINKAQSASVIGMNFTQNIPSSATTSYHAVQVRPSTSLAFTCPLMSDFFAQGVGRSGSAVITRFANYFGTAATQATNNAFIADNSAFSGNYFINSTNANPTKLNGVLQLPSTIATTAGSSVISVTSQLLTTTGGVTTVDWANRQLFDTANNVSVDWQSKILGDTLGNSALNWQTKIAEDNAGNNSINWQSRTLFDSGPNIVFIWNTRSFYDTTASIVAHFDSPGIFNVAQLGVANSAAATIPGTVVKKIEVFDDNGVSLGFLPVYDSIT